MYISSKNPTETMGNNHEFGVDVMERDIHLIPSSSEDLTLASKTSETNGLNTTILNVTTKEKGKTPEYEGLKIEWRDGKTQTFIP